MGRSPPVLTCDTQLNETQQREVRYHYTVFCTAKRLSISPLHMVERILSDGSRLRMDSIHGKDRLFVWPVAVKSQGSGLVAAYPVFTELALSPVYNRQVLDAGSFTKPPYPDEPHFTVPFPQLQYAITPRFVFSRTFVGYTYLGTPNPITGEYPYTLSRYTWHSMVIMGGEIVSDIVGTNSFSSNVHGTYTEFSTDVPQNVTIASSDPSIPDFPITIDPNVLWSAAFNAADSFPDHPDGTRIDTLGVGAIATYQRDDGQTQPLAVGPDVPSPGGGITYIGAALNTGLWDSAISLNASAASEQAANQAAYEAAVAGWYAERDNWTATTYQDWLDACAEIDAMYPSSGPILALYGIRAQARSAQVSALRDYYAQGMAKRHLAARITAFPWNIRTKPKTDLPTTGTITATGVLIANDTDRYIEFTASDADRKAVVPDPSVDPMYSSEFPSDPPHPLGRDIAIPTCIFGWQASGEWQRYAAYRPFHDAELPQITGLDELSMSVRPGYDAYLGEGVEYTDLLDRVICSDGYVPAGTRITMVHFEYEVWDAYSGTWLWTPHVDLVTVDAVWIVSLGLYTLPPLKEKPTGAMSPRAVRIQRVRIQTRQSDFSWAAPKDIAIDAPWQKTVTSVSDGQPPMIAIVEGLAPTAVPAAGTTVFPYGARALWSDGGNQDTIAPALTLLWEGDIDYERLISAAMRASKKA